MHDFFAHKGLIGVLFQVLQSLGLKIIQLTLGHAPRKRLIAEQVHLCSAINFGQVMPKVNGQTGGQWQSVVTQLVVMGDVHPGLDRSGHQLLRVKVAELCDRDRMGLRTLSGILFDHGLAGLVGVEHHPKTHDDQQTAQPLHGPAPQNPPDSDDKPMESIHFVLRYTKQMITMNTYLLIQEKP